MAVSSTVTGFSRGQAHRQERHGDAVIHVGGDRAAARAPSPLPSTVRPSAVSRNSDAIGLKPARDGRQAGRFPSPAVPQGPASRCRLRRRRRRRPGWDIRRSSTARARPALSTPFKARMAHQQIADLLAAAVAAVLDLDIARPFPASVSIRPMRRGLSRMAGSGISEPGTISAATSGNAADDGSRGTSMAQASSSAAPVR